MRPIHTIGHSTRSVEELIGLLRESGIRLLVDVRRYPGSRRHPQFGRDALAAALRAAGIEYVHEPDLGGRREPRPDSPNTAWRNSGFRGYADYMATPPFRAALERLVARGEEEPTAIMCAEAVPWRCHRSLIADALVARGVEVLNVVSKGSATPHRLTPFARVEDGRVTYPAEGRPLFPDAEDAG